MPGDRSAPRSGNASLVGRRAVFQRGSGINEWYEPVVGGVEQGWTFERRRDEQTGIRITLRVGPDVLAEQILPSLVRLRADDESFDYVSPQAEDASGEELPITMELVDGEIVLRIDDADAAYPVTIDPLIVTSSYWLGPGVARTPLYASAAAVHGNVIVVGEPDRPAVAQSNLLLAQGAVHVFRRGTNNAWTRERTIRVTGFSGSEFGASVDVWGNLLIVGAPGEVSQSGGAYVIRLNGSFDSYGRPLSSSVQRLVGPSLIPGQRFGNSVGISQSRAVIGNGSTFQSFHRAFTFAYRSAIGLWELESTLPTSAVPPFGFGHAVDIDPTNMSLVVIGTSNSAYVYNRTVCCWPPTPTVLNAPAFRNFFGSSVALGAGRIAVGAMSIFDRRAELYVYGLSGGTWTSQLVLPATGRLTEDARFSTVPTLPDRRPNVAIYGDTAMLGFPNAYPAGAPTTNSEGTVDAVNALLLSQTYYSRSNDYRARGQVVATDGSTALIARRVLGTGEIRAYNLKLANGTPCSSASECASNYCVAGICCASACNAGPCERCSLRSGGQRDGFCTPVRSELAGFFFCRASGGPCDVDDFCSPLSTVCPQNYVAAETSCGPAPDPANLCDVQDTCTGSSALCPSVVRPAGYVCQEASSACDSDVLCDGTSTRCPPHDPQPCVEICGNGLDDDEDFNTDCFDSDCELSASCIEDCGNGADEDRNALIDCLDPQCAGNASCPPETCGSAGDEDGDGLADCQDPDCASQASCGAVVPDDPFASAPALEPAGAVSFDSSVAFLHEGSDPVQTGVTAGTIDPRHAAAVFGYVYDVRGTALAGATVTVLNQPTLGTTHTRADGRYDLVVNGGGPVTVEIELAGHVSAQRTEEVGWNRWEAMEDVVLVPYDPVVTEVVNPASATEIQVVRGSRSSDFRGDRTATLFILPGTSAEMIDENGNTELLDTMHVRATELTVGERGPERMPAELPPTSGYTYAVELSVDEAIERNGRTVRFSQPAILYLENYWMFTVGQPVPTGYYDRERGQWVPDDSGQVIAIVSEEAGSAALDLDGDGSADDTRTLAITDAELARLAELYEPGQSLWRVPVPHFSTWDCNWPVGPPEDAAAPDAPPRPEPPPDPDPCLQQGSVISCTNRTLGESLPIAGTPYRLTYSSDRGPGYARDRRVRIRLVGDEDPPASLQEVSASVVVGGSRLHVGTWSRARAVAEREVSWTWDGLDAAGRVLVGAQPATITISYAYEGVSGFARRFLAYAGSGAITGSVVASPNAPPRTTLWWHTTYNIDLGGSRVLPGGYGVGGWGISVVHHFDHRNQTLAYGDGRARPISTLNPVTRVAGSCDTGGAFRDEIPALETNIGTQSKIWMALGADGSIYFIDGDRIRRIDPSGIVHHYMDLSIVGGGGSGDSVLGHGLATLPDGSLALLTRQIIDYSRDEAVVHRIHSPTEVELVAGLGTNPPTTGLPATDIHFRVTDPSMAVDADGNIYLAGRYQTDLSGFVGVHVIRPDGRWEVVLPPIMQRPDVPCTTAGGGGDGSLTDPSLKACAIYGLAAAPDGSLVFHELLTSHGDAQAVLRRITPGGRVETLAGTFAQPASILGPDTTDPAAGYLHWPDALSVDSDGAMLLANSSATEVFLRTLRDGKLYRIAGTQDLAAPFFYGPAMGIRLFNGNAIASTTLPMPDGSTLLSGWGCIRRLSPNAFGNMRFGDAIVPSEDGAQLFVFDSEGRHLWTEDALTRARLLELGYDGSHRLESIRDAGGNTTTITWPLASGDPALIRAPFGQVTHVHFDAAGYISRVVDPASGESQMTYTASGSQLETFTDPLARTHTFAYVDGLLSSDTGPASAETPASRTTLSETRIADGVRVLQSTATGLSSTYVSRVPEIGPQRVREVTGSSGLTNTMTTERDGSSLLVMSDGTTVSASIAPDPRFGSHSPYVASDEITLPDGRRRCRRLQRLTPPETSVDFEERTTEWEVPAGAECDLVVNGRRVTTMSWTASTRTLTTMAPTGRTRSVVLDASSRPVRAQVPGVADTVMQYDASGRLERMSQTDSRGQTREVGYAYHAGSGYLENATDGEGRVTHLATDAIGRVTSETVGWDAVSDAPTADAVVTGLRWDAIGNLSGLTPPSRPEHEHGYSPRDELASHVAPSVDGQDLQSHWSYDADRRLSGYASGLYQNDIAQRVQVTDYDYYPPSAPAGSRGRLRTVAFPADTSTAVLTSTYYGPGPAAGQLQAMTRSDGADLSLVWSGDQLTRVSSTIPSPSGAVAAAVSYAYDGPGFVLSDVSVHAGTSSYSARATHDADGLLEGIRIEHGSTLVDALDIVPDPQNGLLRSTSIGAVTSTIVPSEFGDPAFLGYEWGTGSLGFEYTYDDNGRITQIIEQGQSGGNTTLYRYDTQGRLYEVERDGAIIEHYVYDDNGNRLEWTLDDDGAGPLPPRTYSNAVYDARDRLRSYREPDGTSVTFEYDEAGRLLRRTSGTAMTTYTYDALGNLLRVQTPSVLVEYEVDGLGRRVSRSVDGTVTTMWLYRDGLNPVAELDGSGALRRVFVYGTARHSPDLVVEVDSTGAPERVLRVVRDHLGSPRALVNVSTEQVVAQARFDSFGRLVMGDVGDLTIGFAGGVPDSVTGLVRFGRRDYDPVVGRWTATEPLLFAGGDSNLYSYVHNNPINLIDPTGREASTIYKIWTVLWSGPTNAIGLVVGLAGSGTNFSYDADRHAIEFYGNKIVGGAGSGATTFANVICYASDSPGSEIQQHERAHIDQADVLGGLYLPLHVSQQAISIARYAIQGPNADRPGGYNPYSAYNPLEWGPYDSPRGPGGEPRTSLARSPVGNSASSDASGYSFSRNNAVDGCSGHRILYSRPRL